MSLKNMTLESIAAACDGIYLGSEADKKREIAGAVIDSRLVEKGDLFIPIKGEKVDGHRFIPDVFAKGAIAVLTEQELVQPAGSYILVGNTQTAMKRIAEYYRKSLDIKVVGITGSVGKTSTKEMIASVLSQKYSVLKTEGNFNNEIGLPLTIFRIREEHQIAVLEMGISEFGEMHRLAQMANPDICVITNIGLCHLENLMTRDGILKAKTESFEHLTENGIAVLNGDDDKLCEKRTVNGKPALFYGLEEEGLCGKKQVYATDVEALGLSGTKAVIHIGNSSFPVKIPIAGEHNVYNALAAACVAKQLGLSIEEIKRGIESVQTIGGRSNLIYKNGMTIIDDCYNANPVSMCASIDVLEHARGRSIAVLGDMGELGAEEKQLHYQVGVHFSQSSVQVLFTAGTLSQEISRAVRDKNTNQEVYTFETRDQMVSVLKNYVKKGDTILVKASHFMEFSKVVAALKDASDFL